MFNEFIDEIRGKEIVISFSNGKLKYSGPEQYIDEVLIKMLKKHKAKLLKYYWPSDCTNMMPINTEGTKIPFTLLHAGKANYTLSEYFGTDQPFYGFFYIGSEGEKISYKSVESFAQAYLNQLKMIIPTGPYLLGGLSFGGILAYEIAIQLQKQGHEVPFLVLVDCGIPLFKKNGDKSNLLIKSIKRIYHFFENIYYWFYHNIRRLFYEVFIVLKLNLPKNFRKPYILWTYFNLMKKYRPTSQFNGEILLFRTEANKTPTKYLGWENLCKNIQVVTLSGNHDTMYESKESIEILREKIGELLLKANGSYKT
jgi:thioesterase domain-containing protein